MNAESMAPHEAGAQISAMNEESEPCELADRLYKEWKEEPQTFGIAKT